MASVNLDKLTAISRGDQDLYRRFLSQFLAFIPQQLTELHKQLTEGDRLGIRYTLHRMGPQLEFFGLTETLASMVQIKDAYETLSDSELSAAVRRISNELRGACGQVQQALDQG